MNLQALSNKQFCRKLSCRILQNLDSLLPERSALISYLIKQNEISCEYIPSAHRCMQMYMKRRHLSGKVYLLKRTALCLCCSGIDWEDWVLYTAVRRQNQSGRHTNDILSSNEPSNLHSKTVILTQV